ncbi:glycosyltransferase family 4 protein [Leptothermofonsia sp. ETS-13]|uniref:glycosyltransferase family 4 protein n=1 Tax=Leptothermofonsia sp. ETS-13 TaxID=3035696 RepID=UPI003BA1405A
MAKSLSAWICCQLGAREHYAIPRALYSVDQLACLITDAWVTPQSGFNRLPAKISASLKGRFHRDLVAAPVQAFNSSLLQFELTHKLKQTPGWNRIVARNHWFQQQALEHLRAIAPQLSPSTVLFSYSYTALDLFRFAKQQGWQTVLGQIDPGPLEEKIVAAEQAKHLGLEPAWHPVPPIYWKTWQEECALADRIVVNSCWSKQLLERSGIEPAKIRIVSLVYEPPQEVANFTRTYPQAFTPERPLRVLFLGIVTLRKGVAAILEAIQHLQGKPIEFWMVGAQQISIPAQFQNHPQIRWVGQVPRSETPRYYQEADVFLFPTLSDGFGLTQLEAQAWKLPIIASQYCGEVVQNQVNGWVLEEVTGAAIADILLSVLNGPTQLKQFSDQAISISNFNLSFLVNQLQHLVDQQLIPSITRV